MAAYTLTYFDGRGMGEISRLTLAASGAEWSDERLFFNRNADGTHDIGDFAETRKKTLPYGQVPVLRVDGEQLGQSSAITRFVAKRHGLNGSSDIEAALIDAGFEAVQDIVKAFRAAAHSGDAAKLEQFWSGLAQSLAYLNNNVRGPTYFATSNKLSYVDITIYYLVFMLSTQNKDAVDAAVKQSPKIAAICEAVPKEEKIAAYLAKRKETPM